MRIAFISSYKTRKSWLPKDNSKNIKLELLILLIVYITVPATVLKVIKENNNHNVLANEPVPVLPVAELLFM